MPPLDIDIRTGEVQHHGSMKPIALDRVPHRRETLDAYMILSRRVHDTEAARALDTLWAAITAHVPESL